MARLLAILTLILSIVLFPPAVLALISNNAVPGDATYPIKRGLEDIIFSVASVHSVTKAWFSSARSDRRFKELNILVTRGRDVNQTLDELVEQTQVAAGQIAQIDDKNQKAQLVERLTESIKKYDKGLEQLSPQIITSPSPSPQAPTPSGVGQAPSPTAEPVVQPTSEPAATATPVPRSTFTPRSTAAPTPTAAPQTTSKPAPSPPSPPSPSGCDAIEDPIERARCRLQEIQQGLGAASQDISPPMPSPSPQETERRGRDRDRDSDRGEGRGSERRGEREEERDSSGRGSDRGNNRDRGQGRDR